MVVRRAVLQAVLCTLALCAAGIGPSSEGCWKHVRRVTEYGAMGAGRTLNTAVFARAVADLARCAGDGGAAQVDVCCSDWGGYWVGPQVDGAAMDKASSTSTVNYSTWEQRIHEPLLFSSPANRKELHA